MKKKTKITLGILAAAVLLNIVMNAFGNALKTEHYSAASEKVNAPVRIVFISDLHNCTYGGADQSEIWSKITAEEPDLVLFGGDVIDFQGGTSHAITLMKMVRETYPCAYAAGNHEVMRSDTAEFFDAVDALGIPVLHGSSIDLTLNGQQLRISGVIHAFENPDQLNASCETLSMEKYNILLAHQPEQLPEFIAESEKYSAAYDLVLSGHAHGGQWRIPKLLPQGLYAPDQGIFPAFTGGQREIGGTVQIVSRGLAKPLRMIIIPRIFNRPELTVVEIVPA